MVKIILLTIVLSLMWYGLDCKINVHLVAHTHDDLGWIKTIKEYYEQTFPETGNRGCVRCIYDSVFKALQANHNRTFAICEIGFFKLWWEEQTADLQFEFQRMVSRGQIEFVSGGMSSNDEATAHYEDIIVNFEAGHTFLLENFDVRPQVGWQMDPFGHSSTHAMLASQFGLNLLVLGRIFGKDKENRIQQKQLDFLWKPFPNKNNLPTSSSSCGKHCILTHVLYDSYIAPNEICFDESTDYCHTVIPQTENDIIATSKLLMQTIRNRKKAYLGTELLMVVGNDFGFKDASRNFDALDKVINQINAFSLESDEDTISIQYSTPVAFLQAFVKNANNTEQVMTKEDDFFPYSWRGQEIWTGYFTSRPILKYKIRDFGRKYLAYNKVLARLSSNLCLDKLEQSVLQLSLKNMAQVLGNSQHHDAITGTSVQHVIPYYLQQIKESDDQFTNPLFTIVNKHLSQNISYYECDFDEKCHLQYNNTEDIYVQLFNSQDSAIFNKLVQLYLPKGSQNFQVFRILQGNQEKELESEVICLKQNAEECCIYFTDDFLMYNFQQYVLKRSQNEIPKQQVLPIIVDFNNRESMQSIPIDAEGKQKLTIINSTSFTFESCDIQCNQIEFYLDYKSYYDTAGAYTMNVQRESLPYSYITDYHLFIGKIIKLIYIQRADIKTKIQLGPKTNAFFISSQIQSIPLNSDITLNIFVKQIQNGDEFYTDSNAMSMIHRRKNFQPTYQSCTSTQCNYYPVTSRIEISDPKRYINLALFTDRAQGGSSLKEGEVELMLHRRLKQDDYLGMNEALNEIDAATGQPIEFTTQHVLLFQFGEKKQDEVVQIQNQIDQKLLIFYGLKESNGSTLNQSISNKTNNNDSCAMFFKLQQEQLQSIENKFQIQNSIKLTVSLKYEDTYIVRLHNMGDAESEKIHFFSAYGSRNYLLEYVLGVCGRITIESFSELNLSTNHQIDSQYLAQSVYPWKPQDMMKDYGSSQFIQDYITIGTNEMRTFIFQISPISKFASQCNHNQ